jgi:hypothetical protein
VFKVSGSLGSRVKSRFSNALDRPPLSGAAGGPPLPPADFEDLDLDGEPSAASSSMEGEKQQSLG